MKKILIAILILNAFINTSFGLQIDDFAGLYWLKPVECFTNTTSIKQDGRYIIVCADTNLNNNIITYSSENDKFSIYKPKIYDAVLVVNSPYHNYRGYVFEGDEKGWIVLPQRLLQE